MADEIALIDPYSGSAVPLFLLTPTKQEMDVVATGFFYELDNRFYLVTNWHVFSGREPINGQAKHNSKAVPHYIELHFHKKNDVGSSTNSIILDLYQNNEEDRPLWIQHEKGQEIDIGLREISKPQIESLLQTKIELYPVNKLFSFSEDILVRIGQELFVLGFPFGLFKTGLFPIWKRGTTASEPNIPIDNLPYFLIDTATREGMSGSPVIYRSYDWYIQKDGQKKFTQNFVTKFMGVYSGRYGADKKEEAQLGIVWKPELIEEIIRNPHPGSYNLLKYVY